MYAYKICRGAMLELAQSLVSVAISVVIGLASWLCDIRMAPIGRLCVI